MPKITKSIRGELVDFDLVKIKESIKSSPSPLEVTERREYIDNKLQRRIKKAKDNIQRNVVTQTKPKNGLVDLRSVDGTVQTHRKIQKVYNDDQTTT